ncbi:CstA-like transporter-associated (seleno)protein [Saccharopolyspora sp. NPDC002376]
MTGTDRAARPGRRVAGALRRAAHRAIWYVREVVGENDYQRYVDHLRARHPDRTPPSRREFERMKTDRPTE